MIPIKNKKKTLEVTVEEMRNFAFNYIEKFAPSKQQLKTYLLKKYLKSKTPINRSNVSNLIDKVRQENLSVNVIVKKNVEKLKILHVTNFNERFNGRLFFNTVL